MVEISHASIKDLSELRNLEYICFPVDHWPLLDLIGVLTLPGIIRLKALVDGLFVGFIAGTVNRKTSIGWITTIGVLPDYQNRGIAQKLLRECETMMKMKNIKLTVRRSNTKAINLYEKNGYFIQEIWDSYYVDGEDAILFQKSS